MSATRPADALAAATATAAPVDAALPTLTRNDNLQALRGIAAALVFVLHAMLIEQKYGQGAVLIGRAGWLGSVAVDLFFAISGFIMVAITRDRFGAPREAGRFLLERVFRIYPAYWCVSAAVLVVYLLRPGLVNASQGGQVDVLASLLLLPQAMLPLLSVGWTLVHEMYFYLVFAALITLLPRGAGRRAGLPLALAAWAVAVLLGQAAGAAQAHPAVRLAADPLTLNFIAGAAAALLWPHVRPAWGPALVLAGLVAFALGLAWVPASLEQVFFDRPWRAAVCALPCALVTLGAVAGNGRGPWLGRRAWVRLGDVSYSFYLVHLLVLSLAGKLWSALLPPTAAAAALLFGLSFAACLLLSHLGWRWVEQPTQRWGKRLARRWFAPAAPPAPGAALASEAAQPSARLADADVATDTANALYPTAAAPSSPALAPAADPPAAAAAAPAAPAPLTPLRPS
jgi:peptidoglycan/LPS O-acetylase OafA/YrhL